jgi:3-polyprenyl-4-hydroxybenzoate decarboxylase
MLCFAGCNGTIVSYDPERGTHGLTKTRLGLFDWDKGDPSRPFPEQKIKRYGFATMARPGRLGQGNTGRYYFDNYRAKDKPWPAVYVYGLPTDVHVLAALKTLRWPETGDEYEILGGLRGEPVELVEAETIPGLMVPAHAEWVIEGEFVSEDYRTPTYSEDVGIGCIWGEALWPVFKVNCITHRRDPLWDATTFSSLGHEDHQGVHSGLYWTGIYSDILYRLRSMGYKVKDVVIWGMFVAVVQLEVDGKYKPHPGYGEEVGRATAAKYTIVVGPDIDPHNLEAVMWAVGMRADRGKWFDLPKPPPGSPTPPKYGIMFELAEIGYQVIDATIPVPERFDTFPPRSEPPKWEDEAIQRMRKKLGPERQVRRGGKANNQ